MLRWNMQPAPTIYSRLPRYCQLSALIENHQPPTERIFQEDELAKFMEADKISSFDDLDESRAPPGFQYRRCEDHVVYYRMVYDPFPTVKETIHVDENLHVKLQYKGNH